MSAHAAVMRLITAIRESRDDNQLAYTSGGCYQFYLILASVFPEATAWYDSDHVITRIEGRFYDVTGEITPGRHIPIETDPAWQRDAPLWRYTCQ